MNSFFFIWLLWFQKQLGKFWLGSILYPSWWKWPKALTQPYFVLGLQSKKVLPKFIATVCFSVFYFIYFLKSSLTRLPTILTTFLLCFRLACSKFSCTKSELLSWRDFFFSWKRGSIERILLACFRLLFAWRQLMICQKWTKLMLASKSALFF